MIRQDGSVRKLRRSFNEVGHAHELTFSCYHRLPLLSKDRTRQWFMEALGKARVQHHFAIWAYVVMPEHAHVLIHPLDERYEVAQVLQSVKQSVSRRATNYLRIHSPQWLERLRVVWPTGRVEHRFWQQGGGYDRNMITSEALWASVEYIHRNPVRRGLVTEETSWEWSSARWYSGIASGGLIIDDGLFD